MGAGDGGPRHREFFELYRLALLIRHSGWLGRTGPLLLNGIVIFGLTRWSDFFHDQRQ
jgi:hypothetical protein